MKSDLEIPAPIPKILSLYLLFVIGFKGECGWRGGDELTGVFINSYVMTACPPEKVTALVESLRPTLKQRGGVCLVSDAQCLIH